MLKNKETEYMGMPQIGYEVLRSRRRSISVEITEGGTVLVRCPYRYDDADIAVFVEKNSDWIHSQLHKYQVRKEKYDALEPFSGAELAAFRKRAKTWLPERCSYFAELLDVDYGKITVRLMKSRWGSCSRRGDLSFHLLLAAVPEEIADYVVVHELCHRVEMNHSKRFWALVESAMPDYRTRRRWLDENGSLLIARAYKGVQDGTETAENVYYAYLLLCADGSFYAGYTPNLRTRLQAHNSGKGAKYTRARLPVQLVYYETFGTRSEAMRREALLKQLPHSEKARLAAQQAENVFDI